MLCGGVNLKVVVTNVPQLNLLSRQAMVELGLTDLTKHFMQHMESPVGSLQKACKQLCQDFPDYLKPELGRLKDFELDVKFKPGASPIFCKPRPVPLAVLEDLNDAYEEGIRKGVWTTTDFNAYGTPWFQCKRQSVQYIKRPGSGSARIAQ